MAKGSDSLMWWYFRRVHIKVNGQNETETFSPHLQLPCGGLRLDGGGTGIIFQSDLREKYNHHSGQQRLFSKNFQADFAGNSMAQTIHWKHR